MKTTHRKTNLILAMKKCRKPYSSWVLDTCVPQLISNVILQHWFFVFIPSTCSYWSHMLVSSCRRLETSSWDECDVHIPCSPRIAPTLCSYRQDITSWLNPGPTILKWFHFSIDKKYIDVPLPEIKNISVTIFLLKLHNLAVSVS